MPAQTLVQRDGHLRSRDSSCPDLLSTAQLTSRPRGARCRRGRSRRPPAFLASLSINVHPWRVEPLGGFHKTVSCVGFMWLAAPPLIPPSSPPPTGPHIAEPCFGLLVVQIFQKNLTKSTSTSFFILLARHPACLRSRFGAPALHPPTSSRAGGTARVVETCLALFQQVKTTSTPFKTVALTRRARKADNSPSCLCRSLSRLSTCFTAEFRIAPSSR